MTTFKYILFGIVTSVLLVSCDPASMDETVKPDEVILKASTDRIDASGQDAVTFNVVADGEDVTGKSHVFLVSDNSELINKRFSTTEPGDYEFYAVYNDVKSKTR